MAQGPNYGLQGGSTWVISDEGTLTIATGGSINVESGGVLRIASGGSFVNAGEMAISGDLEIPSGGTLTVAAGGSIQQAGAQHVTGLTEIASGGSISVASGGSIQNAGAVVTLSGGKSQVLSGGSIVVASGGSIQAAGAVHITGVLTLGGTVLRAAYGTAALTSGVGTIATGLTRAYAAVANAILGEAQGAGSASHVMYDPSLSGAGSLIFRLGSVGGGVWAANGTISWLAHGT